MVSVLHKMKRRGEERTEQRPRRGQQRADQTASEERRGVEEEAE